MRPVAVGTILLALQSATLPIQDAEPVGLTRSVRVSMAVRKVSVTYPLVSVATAGCLPIVRPLPLQGALLGMFVKVVKMPAIAPSSAPLQASVKSHLAGV